MYSYNEIYGLVLGKNPEMRIFSVILLVLGRVALCERVMAETALAAVSCERGDAPVSRLVNYRQLFGMVRLCGNGILSSE